MATLDFLGAVGTVTGSRFLLTEQGQRVLVDCGLFQGLRELRERNWDPLPIDPSAIASAIVTHAHLDHSGYLPVLARDGFTGRVHLTENTGKLAEIVLRDSAHLLVEDTEHARKHGYSRHREPRPLYDDGDVTAALRLRKVVPYDAAVAVADGVEVTLRRAGHILGSASAELRLAQSGRTIVFSGDLGRPAHPFLLPPRPPSAADVIVVESTYGDRAHDDMDAAAQLADVVKRTIRRGGSVVIPAFAVDRTEVILLTLRALRTAGEIPDVPIYVDSPMATAIRRCGRTSPRNRIRSTRATCTRCVGSRSRSGSTIRAGRASSCRRPAWFPAAGSCIISPGCCRVRRTLWCSPATRRSGLVAGSWPTVRRASRSTARTCRCGPRSPTYQGSRCTPTRVRSSVGSDRRRRRPRCVTSCTASRMRRLPCSGGSGPSSAGMLSSRSSPNVFGSE